MVDTLGLGPSAARHGSSSLPLPTNERTHYELTQNPRAWGFFTLLSTHRNLSCCKLWTFACDNKSMISGFGAGNLYMPHVAYDADCAHLLSLSLSKTSPQHQNIGANRHARAPSNVCTVCLTTVKSSPVYARERTHVRVFCKVGATPFSRPYS